MANLIFQKKLLDKFLFEVYDDKPPMNYLKLHQIHSDIVIDTPPNKDIQGDGIVSDFDKTLCVVTADCLPIAVIGKERFALLHAGWKGVQSKILLNNQIEKIEPQFIFIGPSICGDSFEVSSEFQDEFPGSKNFKLRGESLHFNLQQEIIDQARQHYPNAQIYDCKIDTLTTKEYHSYRRDKTASRNFNCLRTLS